MSEKTRLLVAGSRSIDDEWLVEDIIRAYYLNDSPPFRWSCEVVHGGAEGVDTAASTFAQNYDLEETVFEPDWEHGKAAGPIRNSEMAEYADILIAIWDGESGGTEDMIEKAIGEVEKIHIVEVDADE